MKKKDFITKANSNYSEEEITILNYIRKKNTLKEPLIKYNGSDLDDDLEKMLFEELMELEKSDSAKDEKKNRNMDNKQKVKSWFKKRK